MATSDVCGLLLKPWKVLFTKEEDQKHLIEIEYFFTIECFKMNRYNMFTLKLKIYNVKSRTTTGIMVKQKYLKTNRSEPISNLIAASPSGEAR